MTSVNIHFDYNVNKYVRFDYICVVFLLRFMNVASNLKEYREQKGLLQKEVANAIGVHPSNYSKMEKGERDVSIEVADKLAKYYGLTLDQLIYKQDYTPKEVTVEDKTLNEQLRLIAQLEEDDKAMVFKMIDKMLTSKKFKDFFNKNVANL